MFGSNDKKFFEAFNTLAEKIVLGAGLLHEMMEKWDRPEETAHRIKALEHECDEITHDLMRRLNRTFITPFDREDIHDLASKLDDVMDFIDNTANRMVVYRFQAPPPEMAAISDVLMRQSAVLREAVANVKQADHILAKCIEIHSLENEGDRIFHSGIARLFSSVTDPIEVIKQKDLLETVEKATDKCEDAANVLESIMLKNA